MSARTDEKGVAPAEKSPAKRKPSQPILSDGRRNNGGKRKGSGRPAWEPTLKNIEVRPGEFRKQTPEEAMEDTRVLVRHYMAIGYPTDVTCKLLSPPMSDETLRKYFSHEIETGALAQNARVAGTAFQMAVSGRDPGMTRFWCRTRMGWSERQAEASNGPLRVESIPGDEGL